MTLCHDWSDGIDRRFFERDSAERKRLLWDAIRETVNAHGADEILHRILPLLPEFERDVYGEEYHRCFCKRGYDHVSDL